MVVKKIDKLDMKIISVLDEDARASASDISKKCLIPKETVTYRVKKLLSGGFIKYFYTIINSSKLGYRYHRIFLQFHKITAATEKELIDYLISKHSCANLRVLEGTYDMVFITTHKRLEGLKEFISGFMEQFGGVIRQKSIHTIYSSYKYPVVGNGNPKIFSHGTESSLQIDSIDSSILKTISSDARISLTSLAMKEGKDHSLIRYRMKRLIKEGVIVSAAPSIDIGKFGKEHIQVDICLKQMNSVPTILSFFSETGSLLYAYELIGKYDLSVEIIVEDDTVLRTIMNSFRERFTKDYIIYDVSHIYQEFVTNWSPFSSDT